MSWLALISRLGVSSLWRCCRSTVRYCGTRYFCSRYFPYRPFWHPFLSSRVHTRSGHGGFISVGTRGIFLVFPCVFQELWLADAGDTFIHAVNTRDHQPELLENARENKK